jgi:hypothetical protein
MTRLQAFMGGMCMLALALGPGVAEAQPMPENNPQACHDGVDNDGNGYVDCNDQQCAPFCQQQYQQPPPGYQQPPPGYQQPPPGYQQPPPGYYQQPPPGYYAPPPPPAYPPGYNYAANIPPPSGLGQLITGSILLPLGIVFIIVSVPLWNDACGPSSDQFGCVNALSPGYAEAIGALWLDLIGVVFVIAGLVMIPIGAARYGRYRRWRSQHGFALYDGHGLTISPVFGGAAMPSVAGSASSLSSAALGLKFSF